MAKLTAAMKKKFITKELLSLAGEHRVVSELCKLGVFAAITPGYHKQNDIYASHDATNRTVRIEVKASQIGRFVTRIGQRKKAGNPPNFWVLVSFKQGSERFFVLNNAEIVKLQKKRNRKYLKGHPETDISKGVDNLPLADVKTCENCWGKIMAALGVAGDF